LCQKIDLGGFLTDKNWSKNEILVKNRNFGKKSKFRSKIEIMVKNQNLDQK